MSQKFEGIIYVLTNDKIIDNFGPNTYKLGKEEYDHTVSLEDKTFNLFKRYDFKMGRRGYYKGSNLEIKMIHEVSQYTLAESMLFKFMSDSGFKSFNNYNKPDNCSFNKYHTIGIFEIPDNRLEEVYYIMHTIALFCSHYDKRDIHWRKVNKVRAVEIIKKQCTELRIKKEKHLKKQISDISNDTNEENKLENMIPHKFLSRKLVKKINCSVSGILLYTKYQESTKIESITSPLSVEQFKMCCNKLYDLVTDINGDWKIAGMDFRANLSNNELCK